MPEPAQARILIADDELSSLELLEGYLSNPDMEDKG